MEHIPITKEESETANEEAAYIYGYLRKKYANESVAHLDIVLNSLCFALLRMIHNNVIKEDRKLMVGVITAILTKELRKDA